MTAEEFRDAFHRYKDVVYRFAYRMTGAPSTAEDIVQDCFTALWKNPRGFDPARGELRAYLLGVARNQVFKHWRRTRPHEVLDEEDSVCPPFDVSAFARGEAVRKAVLSLPPLQRESLILAEYEDCSLDEIAQATGVELAAVKSRLHRARQNLRRMLTPLMQSKGTIHATK